MAGTRSLTHDEERRLLRVVRKLSPRNRALVTIQWFTGFRIHEVLSLTVGNVHRAGQILEQIGIAPRNLKGERGRTRWVPVLAEMERALERLVAELEKRDDFSPTLPLFLSRQRASNDRPRAISRMQAYDIIKAAFQKAGIFNDGRLGTHSLRKTFA